MTTYAVHYTLGAVVTVVVTADAEDDAVDIARDLAEERLLMADAVLAERGLDVSLIGIPDLAEVEGVTS